MNPKWIENAFKQLNLFAFYDPIASAAIPGTNLCHARSIQDKTKKKRMHVTF
jgi:hypothetical protein